MEPGLTRTSPDRVQTVRYMMASSGIEEDPQEIPFPFYRPSTASNQKHGEFGELPGQVFSGNRWFCKLLTLIGSWIVACLRQCNWHFNPLQPV